MVTHTYSHTTKNGAEILVSDEYRNTNRQSSISVNTHTYSHSANTCTVIQHTAPLPWVIASLFPLLAPVLLPSSPSPKIPPSPSPPSPYVPQPLGECQDNLSSPWSPPPPYSPSSVSFSPIGFPCLPLVLQEKSPGKRNSSPVFGPYHIPNPPPLSSLFPYPSLRSRVPENKGSVCVSLVNS